MIESKNEFSIMEQEFDKKRIDFNEVLNKFDRYQEEGIILNHSFYDDRWTMDSGYSKVNILFSINVFSYN